MEELLNGYFLQVFTFVCINIILALTIYMTLCTGILSLGNAGLMSFGAYTSAILTADYGFPMPLGIFCGGLMVAFVAMIIGLPTIRLRGLYLAIATLGFGEVVRVIALNLTITHGAINSEVIIEVAPGVVITSQVTTSSVHELGLVEGAVAYAVIKADSVMLGVD